MSQITIIGGGIAGLTAAITAAEAGAEVQVLEAHDQLGGRARSTDGPYRANLGPHALYKDGPMWAWMRERDLLPQIASPPLGGIRVRWQGELRRTPPLASIPTLLRLRGRDAPVEQTFHSWVSDHADEHVAAMLSAAAGVYTFHHDPGELSAAFVWPRAVRTFLSVPPPARYPVGGWSTLVQSLVNKACALGVTVHPGQRVRDLPAAPVVIATELCDARELLGDGIVPDAELEPHRARPDGEDVVDVGRDVVRATKDVDEVDRPGHVRESPVHGLAEDLGHLGVVDWNGDHLVARALGVGGHVVRGRTRLGDLDPEHGDAVHGAEQRADARGCVEQVGAPGVWGCGRVRGSV